MIEYDGYFYGLFFVLSSVLNGISHAPIMHDQMVEGYNYQVQACSIIYKKLLRLNLRVGHVVQPKPNVIQLRPRNRFFISFFGV